MCYTNPSTLIDCENCADKTLCSLYQQGARMMLRCPSNKPIKEQRIECSATVNEDTPVFTQAEGSEE